MGKHIGADIHDPKAQTCMAPGPGIWREKHVVAFRYLTEPRSTATKNISEGCWIALQGAVSSHPFQITMNQQTAKGASRKGPRQKTSKIVKKCQKYFRHFSTFFAQGKKKSKIVKKCQKLFSTLCDNFRAAPVFRPFWGPQHAKIHLCC